MESDLKWLKLGKDIPGIYVASRSSRQNTPTGRPRKLAKSQGKKPESWQKIQTKVYQYVLRLKKYVIPNSIYLSEVKWSQVKDTNENTVYSNECDWFKR